MHRNGVKCSSLPNENASFRHTNPTQSNYTLFIGLNLPSDPIICPHTRAHRETKTDTHIAKRNDFSIAHNFGIGNGFYMFSKFLVWPKLLLSGPNERDAQTHASFRLNNSYSLYLAICV